MTTKRRGTRIGLAAPLGLAAILLASAGRDAVAQYATSIPFDTWSAAYDSYIYPVVPSNPSIPNGARYNANDLGAPNQFNSLMGLGPSSMDAGYLNPLGVGRGGPTLAPGTRSRLGPYTGGRYIPYWSVNRLYDTDFGRTYTPNEKADAEYYSNRDRREELYAAAREERDPVKRAELLKQAEQATRDARRELGAARRRNLGEPSTTAPGSPPSAGAAATPPSSAPAPRAPTANERPTRGVRFTKEELARAREAAQRRSSRGTPLETDRSQTGESRGTDSPSRESGEIPAPPPLGGAASRAPRDAESPDQVLERGRRMGLGSDLDVLSPYNGFRSSPRGGSPAGGSTRRTAPPAPR